MLRLAEMLAARKVTISNVMLALVYGLKWPKPKMALTIVLLLASLERFVVRHKLPASCSVVFPRLSIATRARMYFREQSAAHAHWMSSMPLKV